MLVKQTDLARMRLDIGNDPTGLVSAFGLIAEAGAIALRLPGRPADRAFKQMTDAQLQHRFRQEPDGAFQTLASRN